MIYSAGNLYYIFYSQLHLSQHAFCESCLQHYAIYKVGIFQEVICPHQDCNKTLDRQGIFYKNLPQDIKNKQRKIYNFYKAAKDPNIHLCPNQNCNEGILNLQQGVNPTCNVCNKTFCHNCFFPAHQGKCENNQVDFFQKNLHYRQCNKCKNVIQRSQGCNHMTCKCGYQFCYICGGRWTGYDHICGKQQIVGRNTQNNDRGCWQRYTQGNIVKKTLQFMIVGVISFPIWLLMSLLLLIVFLLICLILFIGCIFIGFFCESCQLIKQRQSSGIKCILIIFFPFTMISGVFVALDNDFIDGARQQWNQTILSIISLAQCLLCWPLSP